ncbi:LysR family transcriptional regulator [Cupriavidus sp. WGlv3]|uniref:LysR family transcriptional regulator n=1 Tax=Cupriavidus sp. WGlv3 TaxID=2919924 RepID=UPI0020917614|nr:LysR family transcriptional regulator [Cupriavidus sp. WGlv3]MCO4863379.1 LysR family transcriptional regulator [Cupriavidus sp. WGlv3]
MVPDLNQLRCFIAVGEELHFGRAAARLFMTQSPLSRQIRLLEESLGVRLFDRNSRAVRLTAAGAALLDDARRLLALAGHAVDTARRIDKGVSGKVRIGFTAVAGYDLVPNLIANAGEALPEIEATLHEMVTVAQVGALQAGIIDLGFMRPITDMGPGLQWRLAVSEPLQLAMPAGHTLAQRAQIGRKDLAGLPFIQYSATEGKYFHDLIGAVLAGTSRPPRVVQQMSQTHSVIALVRAGLGVALVPASARHLHFPHVLFRPIWRDDVRAELHLIWREPTHNPACRVFADFAAAYLERRAELPGHAAVPQDG